MKTAIMTASYVGDFERCRLLCETIDRFFSGNWHHYLLVERRDVDLFRQFAGERRSVVSEAELFPAWLRSFPDPLGSSRRIWPTPFTLPLRGWHAQQLRRLALARHIEADTLLSIDSEVVIVRPFDPASLWFDGRMRFYRVEDGKGTVSSDHPRWIAHAGDLLGLPRDPGFAHDYITAAIPWRVDTARALLDHIERISGTGWLRAVMSSRDISECMIYGRFVDEVLDGAGHSHDPRPLCHVLWQKGIFSENRAGLVEFMRGLSDDQIAIAVQSFVGHPLSDIRELALGLPAAPAL
ncbi:hypothetical protein E2A64_04025 [Pseudohoeflea suaedae]|uniref:Glycosyl transferase n=1 Tax=Pseudohoeflea suaedae TaxID=877384 RepID=A0A4R5PMU4_9HYPH|nr:DUF6492 family protein [Pseudohoeflea suaedae]TDH38293.1 hypothetical protein E2A64_04025 [Pseudohoeflea suaedae]